MKQNNLSNFEIRQFVPNDTNRVIFIWEQCDLVSNWNNPNFDIQRKIKFQKELFFVGLGFRRNKYPLTKPFSYCSSAYSYQEYEKSPYPKPHNILFT